LLFWRLPREPTESSSSMKTIHGAFLRARAKAFWIASAIRLPGPVAASQSA
jgi:hypothetical protein